MKSPLRSLIRGAVATREAPKPPVPLTGRAEIINVLSGNGSNGSNDRQVEMYKHSTALYSAAGFNAQAVSGITWRMFQTGDGRGRISGPDPRKEIVSHQAVRLWNQPNPFMTGQFFREYFQLLLELTGVVYWVVERNAANIPVSIWPVRRSSIVPVPDPEKYLVGYVYIGEMGEKIPLQLDEVIALRLVDPSDPLGGVAPAQPLMTDLESAKLTAEFRRNFFKNSANPGGIIELDGDENLSDEDFYQLDQRWAEQHRGVRNAHRVAILERGKWVQNDQSLKDLMLVELRQDDRDVVYEGYRTSKSLMGVTEDVNRANAEANEYVYAKWTLVPKLARIRDALNYAFLPMFSSAANGAYEFDFDNPIPADWQADAETTSKNAAAAVALITAGADPVSTLEAMSFPTIKWNGPATPPALPQPPPTDGDMVDRLAARLTSWGSL